MNDSPNGVSPNPTQVFAEDISDGESSHQTVSRQDDSPSTLPYVNPFSIRTFDELREQYRLLFQPTHLRHWRLLYPNHGQLDGFEHFGTVLILATDGIEALFHADESGTLWKGHLLAFNGPIAKEYVEDDDWDFERRKRKVRVFKRADGTMVIIPQDSCMETYWSKWPRMTKEEHQVFEAASHGHIEFSEIDASLEQLRQRVSGAPTKTRKAKTKRQLALESL